MHTLKRKIKTTNRKPRLETKTTGIIDNSWEDVSTETWHKMNMWYLSVERNVHTNHSW